jgi:nicotinate-nucleotide pyrophosphorylase (carboxylating)
VGVVEAQADGIVSGIQVAATLARLQSLSVRCLVRDGERIRRGQPLLLVGGNARRLLSTERTLLNLLMHLSGVATRTGRMVAEARRGSRRTVVAATRKTLPGLRDLEKAAVVDGGGDPHRRDLSSAILVKNNHLTMMPLSVAIARAQRRRPRGTPLIVEVSDLAAAQEAVRQGADRLLLDNLSPAQVRRLVAGLERLRLRRRVTLEVSGGVDERNVAAYARAGADVVSVGALTHSAQALPVHLVVRPERSPSRPPSPP